MTDDSLVYTFTLNYNPKPLGSAPVVRTSQAAVIVECHYPRCVKKYSYSVTEPAALGLSTPNIYILIMFSDKMYIVQRSVMNSLS